MGVLLEPILLITNNIEFWLSDKRHIVGKHSVWLSNKTDIVGEKTMLLALI